MAVDSNQNNKEVAANNMASTVSSGEKASEEMKDQENSKG